MIAPLLAFLFCGLLPPSLPALEKQDWIRLKQAGIEDETVQLLIREKSIETCAFTVADIIDLKKAGLSNETIRLLIAEYSFLRDRQPIIYGEETRSVRFTSVVDIIRLKNEGVSDEVIQAILQVIKEEDSAEKQRAWNMLESMGIWVDRRPRR
jgi:hypothetical protein